MRIQKNKNFYPGTRNVLEVDQIPRLIRLIKKQCGNNFAPYGKPIEIFAADGFMCVRYENNQWFHYDLLENTWW